MIVGIGVDMVNIEKMVRIVERWGRFFLERVFNEEELERIPSGRLYYQRLAARFAAKEAVIKATSNYCLLTMKDVVVLNREDGAPFCRIKKALDLDILISLTHIPEYAIATAIAQKKV